MAHPGVLISSVLYSEICTRNLAGEHVSRTLQFFLLACKHNKIWSQQSTPTYISSLVLHVDFLGLHYGVA